MTVALERPPRPPRDAQDMMRWALDMNEWALRMWRRSGGPVDAVAVATTTATTAVTTATTAATTATTAAATATTAAATATSAEATAVAAAATASTAAATAATAAAATEAISAGASTGFTLSPASVLSVQDIDEIEARIAVAAHNRTQGGATVAVSAGVTTGHPRGSAYTVYYSDPTGPAGAGGTVTFLATDTPADAAASGMRRIGEIFLPYDTGGIIP